MKKILASLLIALMLINVGIYVFADETKSTGAPTQSTTENVSATLKMTSEIKLDEKNKEVKVKIGYGEIKGLGEGELISYQGIITYSQEYFGELTQDDIKAESGYTAVYNPENKRLIVEATRTPKSNENTVEITFKLKENVKDVTTSIELKLEEFTDSKTDFETTTLKTDITITSNTNDATKTEATKTESTKEDQSNKTESTKEDDKKGELEILTETTKTDATKTETTKTDNVTKDTTVSPEKTLPKTGVTTVALIILAVLVVGILSLVRYRNIEIK